jgi:hypothetical protein
MTPDFVERIEADFTIIYNSIGLIWWFMTINVTYISGEHSIPTDLNILDPTLLNFLLTRRRVSARMSFSSCLGPCMAFRPWSLHQLLQGCKPFSSLHVKNRIKLFGWELDIRPMSTAAAAASCSHETVCMLAVYIALRVSVARTYIGLSGLITARTLAGLHAWCLHGYLQDLPQSIDSFMERKFNRVKPSSLAADFASCSIRVECDQWALSSAIDCHCSSLLHPGLMQPLRAT